MATRNFPYGVTGKTLYGVVRNSLGQFWYPTGITFEAYNASHWSNYGVALAESGASGEYTFTVPAAIASADKLTVTYRLQLGGSPATTDAPAGSDEFDWTGSAVGSAVNAFDSITIEANVNARQALSGISAATVGKLSGAGVEGGQIVFAAIGNPGTPRVTATCDNDGNRPTVILSLPT